MNLFEIVYILISSSIFLITLLGRGLKSKIKNESNKTLTKKKISVIIPFRNEEDNLLKLTKSIDQLLTIPFEFLWINDHSEDNSISILQTNRKNDTIIQLIENEEGKKTAIQKGIMHAKGDYIITWDADIIVDRTYF